MNKFLIIICFVVPINLWAQKDQLIVFTDLDSRNVVLTDFNSNYLTQINELGQKLDLDIITLDAKEGLPNEVTSLPSIYFIHSGKKNLYKGRYNAIDRLKSFITNQRTFGFDPTLLSKSNMFVWKKNKFEIGINTKVTSLKSENSSVAEKDIYQQVFEQLKSSFKKLEYEKNYSFVEQSKLYYLNIYPYQANNGMYYFSYEVFSQHNCIEPIYQSFEKPFSGKTINSIIPTLALDFEIILRKLLNDTILKDGLYIPSTSVNSKTWEELNIILNATNTGATKKVNYVINSGTYSYVKSTTAPIAFTFPPPVSQYAGTIDEMDGEFSFDFSHLKGQFSIEFNSLDMGDESLNESVLFEQLLAKQFPSATISFAVPLSTIPVFEAFPIPAKLNFMGLEFDQMISAEFKPISTTEIIVTSNFSLNITKWPTLEKPDGPSPQKETVQIYANFKVVKK